MLSRADARFSLRGIEKVRDEWSLVCVSHNLLKLFRAIGSLKRIPTYPAA